MQSLDIKVKGLYTYPSDFSEVPEGALAVADNIVIDRDSVAEPRRGFGYLTHGAGVQSAFSDPSYRADKLFFYQNETLCHYGSTHFAYHNSSTGWVDYSGSYSPPSATIPVRSAQANENFYFTTSQGVYRLDSYNGTPAAIGVPPALDVQVTAGSQVTPTATVDGTTNVLTSVSSVTGLAIGMHVTGTGIASNSYITSFNGSTITLNNNTTSPGSGVTLTCSAPSTWLATAASGGLNTTGYRVMWVFTDANQNLIQGAPSSIAQFSNLTASAIAPIVQFTIPPGITVNHQYQIYRDAAVASGSIPLDDGGLVYQGNPIAADLTYGTISVLDIVPDSLRGATIYTAQSQLGIANENVQPPLAKDIAVFRNCLFLANTSSLQLYNLTLLGTGTPSGIQSGDTIVIDGVTFTAGSSETISTGTFAVAPVVLVTPTGTTHSNTTIDSISSMTSIAVGQSITGTGIPAGTFITAVNGGGSSITISQSATASGSGITLTITGDSAAQAIADTANSLVRVINRYTSSTVFAYYLSGPTDLPGMILIEGRTVGQSAFHLTSSRSTCWSPALPSSGTTQTSTNDVKVNYLYYSQVLEPEAIPLGNFIPVGSGDKAILRIIALRDSLFILKEDGVFYLTGTDPTNFEVWPLDYTAVLIAPESAVSLNNQIYGLTTQGVVSITQNGVSIMSRPIEGDLFALIADNYTTLQNTSFGVAYESSRAYYLWCIAGGTDTYPTQYYRYNYITNTWTHALLSKYCGAVNPVVDKLYLGNALLDIVDVENKNLSYTDYADYQSTQTITDVSSTSVTITSSDTIAVGSILFQSASVFATVTAVDPITGIVTISLPIPLANGATDVLAPITCNMQWVPVTFANPGISKQIREVNILFKSFYNGPATVTFSSDVSPSSASETITASGNLGVWGLFAWGGPFETSLGATWGGQLLRGPQRIMVPKEQQRCSLLNVEFSHSYAYSPWQLQGLSVIGNNVSERTDN